MKLKLPVTKKSPVNIKSSVKMKGVNEWCFSGGGGAVQGDSAVKGDDAVQVGRCILAPISLVKRQTGVKTLPCPIFFLQAEMIDVQV